MSQTNKLTRSCAFLVNLIRNSEQKRVERQSPNIFDSKLSTSSSLVNWPHLFRHECKSAQKSAKSARNWAQASSWLSEAECARCSLVLLSSEILELLPSARTFSTSARGLSACRESIAVYLKLGERGRVTFNHRERNVSGTMGFQNKTPIRCQSWININELKRIRTTFKQSHIWNHLITHAYPTQINIYSLLSSSTAMFDLRHWRLRTSFAFRPYFVRLDNIMNSKTTNNGEKVQYRYLLICFDTWGNWSLKSIDGKCAQSWNSP